jgi:hypothetical protein
MARETVTNPLPVNPLVDDDNTGNDFGLESTVRATSSSPTRGTALMVDGKIPEMFDFFKKTTVTDFCAFFSLNRLECVSAAFSH